MNLLKETTATYGQVLKVLRLFDKLIILRNFGTVGMRKMNERPEKLRKYFENRQVETRR